MREASEKEVEKDLGENFGPVLRSSKKKGEMDVMVRTSAPCLTRCFSRLVVSKWNVVFAYMKMMVPNDCRSFLAKKTSLVIRAQPCCSVTRALVRTNIKKQYNESNVLFMWRKKRMKENEWQCFSLGCFHFLFLYILSEV